MYIKIYTKKDRDIQESKLFYSTSCWQKRDNVLFHVLFPLLCRHIGRIASIENDSIGIYGFPLTRFPQWRSTFFYLPSRQNGLTFLLKWSTCCSCLCVSRSSNPFPSHVLLRQRVNLSEKSGLILDRARWIEIGILLVVNLLEHLKSDI